MGYERQGECAICGKEFSAVNAGHKYCSRECAAKGKAIGDRERHLRNGGLVRERLVRMLVCPICGANFKPRQRNQECCSKACGDRWHYIKQKSEEGRKALLARREAREQTATSEAMTKHQRRCHDCGKPCTNYRCASCWQRRGRKLGFNAAEITGAR